MNSKFRVWNDIEKKMYYSDEGCMLILERNRWSLVRGMNSLCDSEEGKLMWFTGLKDKNGKETYEGDIVSYPIWINGVEVLRKYGEIVWDEEEAEYLTFVHPESYNQVEVIGNIYENPKLIK